MMSDKLKRSFSPDSSGGGGGHWLRHLRPNPSQSQIRSFREKVVGVTFENRQEVIAAMEIDEQVRLKREPENPFDPNAIKVERLNGDQIGYISRDLAEVLTDEIDECGGALLAEVSEISGGVPGYDTLGVIICFTFPRIAQH